MTDLFDFVVQANHFAVMGNPVAHSQSPPIHRAFARQFGIRLRYERIQVDAGGFAQALSHFAAHGGAGLNITLPFKRDAYRLCGDRLSARARQAQAVNTIRFAPADGDDGRAMFGDNTDGVGLVRDIEGNLGCEIAAARVLILGAGGAVRGVLGAVLERRPARITIANRTANRARELASHFAADADANIITGCGFDSLTAADFDLVINATSASLQGAVPAVAPACIAAADLVYDMMYGANGVTVFLEWARENGARRVADGFGMLVEQAAESFHLWHDRRPETAPVIAALRAS